MFESLWGLEVWQVRTGEEAVVAGVLAEMDPAKPHRHLNFILNTVGPDLTQDRAEEEMCFFEFKKDHSGCPLKKTLIAAAKNGRGYPGGGLLSQT